MFVYIILAALSEPFSELTEHVCCVTEFLFGKGFFYKHTQALAALLKWITKVLFRVYLWAKILLSIANSTSKCSAENLGSKVTNSRRGSFPRGYDQRSRSQFFSNMYCLDASKVIDCLRKYFAIFCSQLALWLVYFLPSGLVREVAL